jgi:hypothetical protein
MRRVSAVLVVVCLAVVLGRPPRAEAKGRDAAMIIAGTISVGLAIALIVSAVGDDPEKKPKASDPPPAKEFPLEGDPFVPSLPGKAESPK